MVGRGGVVPASYLIYEYITVAGQKAKKPAKANGSNASRRKSASSKLEKSAKKLMMAGGAAW